MFTGCIPLTPIKCVPTQLSCSRIPSAHGRVCALHRRGSYLSQVKISCLDVLLQGKCLIIRGFSRALEGGHADEEAKLQLPLFHSVSNATGQQKVDGEQGRKPFLSGLGGSSMKDAAQWLAGCAVWRRGGAGTGKT